MKKNAARIAKKLPFKDHEVLSAAEYDLQEKVVSEQPGSQTVLSAAVCKCNETNFIATETKIQELLLEKMNYMINRINTLEEKIDKLSSAASIDSLSVTSDVMKRFPLKDDEQLVHLEKFISDEENRKALVINLKGIGGSHVYHIVTNILKRVLSNDVAELYSWAGAKKKKVFQNLQFSKAILETTRIQFPSVTEQVVGNFIANWLRHAKQRKDRAEGTASAKTAICVIQN